MTVRIGQLISLGEGDLNYFGRDFYGPARVEGIGADWVVVRDEQGVVWLASGIVPEHVVGGSA